MAQKGPKLQEGGALILVSRGYRWEDLADCRELALSIDAGVGVADCDPAKRAFTGTHLVLCTPHEGLRLRGDIAEGQLRAVKCRVRQPARLRDVGLPFASGPRTKQPIVPDIQYRCRRRSRPEFVDTAGRT